MLGASLPMLDVRTCPATYYIDAVCAAIADVVNYRVVKWYYALGDQPYGPVSRAELESLYDYGVISTSTMVLQEGMYNWVPFVDLKKTTQFLPCMGDKPKATQEPDESAPAPELVAEPAVSQDKA